MTAKTRLVDAVKAVVDPVTGEIRFSTSPQFVNGSRINLFGDSMTSMNFDDKTITAMARTSGSVQVTTSTTHGLYAGARVRITNITGDTSISGTYDVTSYVDANNFTFASSGADGAITIGASNPRATNLQRYADNGIFTWLNILSNQLFDINAVVSGNGWTSTTLLSHVLSETYTDANYAWVLIGTNDIIGDVATSTIISNLESIYSELVRRGHTVIAVTIPPFQSTYGSITAARTQAIITVNEWIRSASRSIRGIVLCDVYADMVDPLAATPGTAKSVYTIDGVHPTVRGAFNAGKGRATYLASILPARDTTLKTNADCVTVQANSSNQLDYAPFTSTGGTITAPVTGSGSIPTIGTGWVVDRQGGVATTTVESLARSDGVGYDISLTATGTADNDNSRIYTNNCIAAGRTLTGSTYVFEHYRAVSSVSGSNVKSTSTQVVGTVNSVSNTFLAHGLYASGATSANSFDSDWAGIVRTPPFKYVGSITGVLNAYSQLNFGAAGSAVVHKLGKAAFRKIS